MSRPRLIKEALAIVAVSTTAGCAAFTEHRVGVVDDALTACPKWPRCVSSEARDPDKRVPSLRVRDDVSAENAWRHARGAVEAMPRTTIVDERRRYIRAEVISPWHVYTDDLELLLRPEEGVIEVRSTGRIGYYDFGVNRDRVEALRATLVERGVVRGESTVSTGAP